MCNIRWIVTQKGLLIIIKKSKKICSMGASSQQLQETPSGFVPPFPSFCPPKKAYTSSPSSDIHALKDNCPTPPRLHSAQSSTSTGRSLQESVKLIDTK